jgi:hypothetical protein
MDEELGKALQIEVRDQRESWLTKALLANEIVYPIFTKQSHFHSPSPETLETFESMSTGSEM